MHVENWDKESEVIVVGYGLAGAISAIAAHDAGARVLLLEKQERPGGNSILSGGAMIVTTDVKEAAKYLRECSGGRVSEDLIQFMAQGLYDCLGYVRELAKTVGARVETMSMTHVCYPFPGRESILVARVAELPDQKERDFFDHTAQTAEEKLVPLERRAGYKLMEVAFRNVERRGIEVVLSSPTKRLVQAPTGEITGVIADIKGKETRIKAQKGVILACGGFEFNEWLLKQYCQIQPIYGAGSPGNTGDGIIMCQKVGAALWHMWLLHGGYGFKFPEFRVAFRIPLGGALNPENPARLPWINVNKAGKRFMNEAFPYVQDSAYRPFEVMDCDFYNTRSGVPEFPNIPCYLILDETGRKRGPMANPLWLLKQDGYRWSEDNSAEIAKGWIIRADTVVELARKIEVEPLALEQTVVRWNEHCAMGKDPDFHRIPGSIMPLKTPPYYAIESWPVVTNTQGGPQFNTKCQILDSYGEPIPRLYKAGELGSFYGHLYALSGNLPECVVEGIAAGENAAREHSLVS